MKKTMQNTSWIFVWQAFCWCKFFHPVFLLTCTPHIAELISTSLSTVEIHWILLRETYNRLRLFTAVGKNSWTLELRIRLTSSCCSYSRCALEAWHIRSQPHPLNQERGNLSPAYDRLIAHTAPAPAVRARAISCNFPPKHWTEHQCFFCVFVYLKVVCLVICMFHWWGLLHGGRNVWIIINCCWCEWRKQ